MLEHWPELAVTTSTVGLMYVTAMPYHVRRRHRERMRRVCVLVITRVGHRYRAVLWQITVIIPDRLRRPRWQRAVNLIDTEEE